MRSTIDEYSQGAGLLHAAATSELLGSRRANAANRLLIGRLLAATAHASASRQSRSRLRQADRGHRRHDDGDGRPAHDAWPPVA